MNWSHVLGALLIAAISFGLVNYGRAERLEAAFEKADSAELAWHATADSALEVAAQQTQRAQRSYDLYVKAQEWADSTVKAAYAELAALRPRVVEVRAQPVPVPCAPLIAQRDSLIDDYERVMRTLRSAYNRQVAANAQLRISLTSWRTAHDTLAAVLEARPDPRGEWTPRLSLAAGIDTGGSYDAGFRLRTGNVDVFAGVRDGEKYGRLGLSYPLF